jgi:hypothetical protein
MKNYFLLAAIAGVGLLITGCPPEQVKYINVNGMTIAQKCIPYLEYQGTSVKITLGGGAGGSTISTGWEVTPGVLQRATGTLQAIDQARMLCCEDERHAAYANERPRYERMRDLEEQNTTKFVQGVQIILQQPGANVPPVEAPQKPSAGGGSPTAGTKTPPPKAPIVITKKKAANIHKFVSAYEPKAEERVVLTGNVIPTGAAESAAPGAPAKSVNQRAVMDVLKTRAKPNSYFDLK